MLISFSPGTLLELSLAAAPSALFQPTDSALEMIGARIHGSGDAFIDVVRASQITPTQPGSVWDLSGGFRR